MVHRERSKNRSGSHRKEPGSLPPLPIDEVSMLVRVERFIKEYIEVLTKRDVAHHCIAARRYVRKQLGQLADLMGMKKIVI